jgi:hypothetical protein
MKRMRKTAVPMSCKWYKDWWSWSERLHRSLSGRWIGTWSESFSSCWSISWRWSR